MYTLTHIGLMQMAEADATMLMVWKDISKYLSFHEIAQISKVSKSFKCVTVLGGGSSSTALIMPPGFRSYHRFR